MAHLRHLAARTLGGGCLLAVLSAPLARAHDTIEVNLNALPSYSIKGAWTTAGMASVKVHGMATMLLRRDGLEIELTMADTAAYRLLEHDPYVAPANASPADTGVSVATATTVATNVADAATIHDPHFESDQALLNDRAATLFTITSNGATLPPLVSSVSFTGGRDVVFHLTYTRPQIGPLHVAVNYFNQVPAGQRDIVTIMDDTGKTLLSTDVGAEMPFLDAQIPPPTVRPAASAAPPARQLYVTLAAAIVVGLATLALVSKWRRPADTE